MAIVRKTNRLPAMRWVNAKPGRIIATSFLLVILTGTVLLWLPFATRSGHSVGLLQALFTATSATCVTGLVTVDTATHWSIFGKVVIISLIQIGGLGLVTITSFFYTLMRRKATLRSLMVAQESTASFGFTDVLRLVRKIVLITFSIEVAGGLILSARFIPRFGLARGIGKAFFHAVSAFCNAGFDLFGDTASGPFSSMTAMQDDPVIILTTSALFIIGGLGFVVWSDLLTLGKDHKLNFHSKVVLILTGSLILIGTVFFFLSEYSNDSHPQAMGSLPPLIRPLAAFFQAVTPRTAGFNALDQASLTDSSKFMTIVLMFIGAAPGSTAGGIKITTFAVIVATILSDVQGHSNILLLRHRLSRETFTRAFAIAGLAMTIILTVGLMLSLIERDALEAGQFNFIDILFESTSAFGTVGLSSVGTPNLQRLSWAVLIPVMYLGRIGPASFAISLAMQKAQRMEPVFPEGKTLVG